MVSSRGVKPDMCPQDYDCRLAGVRAYKRATFRSRGEGEAWAASRMCKENKSGSQRTLLTLLPEIVIS